MTGHVWTAAPDAGDVAQLVLLERQSRDRGWFDQEAACFLPDSRVTISWFDGSGADFVARSRELYSRGVRPVHHMGPPVVHQRGDRALAEASAEISSAGDFGGIDAYVVAECRLLYRVERRGGSWGVASLDVVYERDTVVPATVGQTPRVDQDVLAKFRAPYRNLAYQLLQDGNTPRDDLYGDDQPTQLAALYRDAFAWLEGTS